jgi:beta-galactosidase GanA
MNLNTVIASVSWELIEPTEGQFDFSLVDGLITDARANHMHLVFLWFGSWKNGLSSYQPIWVKTDPTRFPLAEKGNGESMDILSTLGDQTCTADAKAFGALMSHIRDFDGSVHTVLAMQVENEVGMREDSRDRSPPANQEFAGPVPQELMDFLSAHKETLMPEFRDQWDHAGGKTSGTWEEVFGAGIATDEIFMAWNYARYVGKIAQAGKAQYPIPMYANCWLDQPGTPKPGDYPSGGPLAHLMDVWHAGAPALDMLSPDLYVREFAQRSSFPKPTAAVAARSMCCTRLGNTMRFVSRRSESMVLISTLSPPTQPPARISAPLPNAMERCRRWPRSFCSIKVMAQ